MYSSDYLPDGLGLVSVPYILTTDPTHEKRKLYVKFPCLSTNLVEASRTCLMFIHTATQYWCGRACGKHRQN